MTLLSALFTVCFAHAHGSARSHHLMVELGRATRRSDHALTSAMYQPMTRADARDAILGLDVGISAIDLVLASCEADLYPARVREFAPADIAAYGASYRVHLRDFRAALVEYRTEFIVQLRRPENERVTDRLRHWQDQLRELARRAHRQLKR